jgi:hypothetical protein
MHDADGLENLIQSSGAEYLVVFPGWDPVYADLVARRGFVPIWSSADQTDYKALSPVGPMTVYRMDR